MLTWPTFDLAFSVLLMVDLLVSNLLMKRCKSPPEGRISKDSNMILLLLCIETSTTIH